MVLYAKWVLPINGFSEQRWSRLGVKNTWPCWTKKKLTNGSWGYVIFCLLVSAASRSLRKAIVNRSALSLTSSPTLNVSAWFLGCPSAEGQRRELETRANLLRKEALQSLTIALAGNDTKRLWDLLTAYFGANHLGDEEDPWDFLDAAPEIPPPLPVTDTDSDDDKTSLASAATTQLAPVAPTSGSQVGVGAKAKGHPKVIVQKDRLDDLCAADKAIRIYPANKDILSETGIPEHLLAPQE